MVFDLVTIGISSSYLWYYSAGATRMSHFLQRLLYEGLGYFILLTAVNVFNLILFRSASEAVQSSGTSLGYVITWITSQRLLISQRKSAEAYIARNGPDISLSAFNGLVKTLDNSKEINQALRSQFDGKSRASMLMPEQRITSPLTTMNVRAADNGSNSAVGDEKDEVRIEREVHYDGSTLQTENPRRPKVLWRSPPPSR